jgi:hypothetical protein
MIENLEGMHPMGPLDRRPPQEALAERRPRGQALRRGLRTIHTTYVDFQQTAR